MLYLIFLSHKRTQNMRISPLAGDFGGKKGRIFKKNLQNLKKCCHDLEKIDTWYIETKKDKNL